MVSVFAVAAVFAVVAVVRCCCCGLLSFGAVAFFVVLLFAYVSFFIAIVSCFC